MSTSAVTAFTGSSQFASALQASLSQVIALASGPLQQSQADLATVQSQQTELNTLSTDFMTVQSAVSSIASAAAANSLSATLSDTSVASVALGSTAQLGSYSLDVLTTGAEASSSSNDGLSTVTDPTTGSFSDATSYTLTVGTSTYNIKPSGDTLSALAAAINQDGHTQATIVNLGSTAAPDYRLFLQGQQLGDHAIQLTANDGSNPGQTLLTPQIVGSSATYQINGQPSVAISTDTPTITIAPGVTVTIQGAGTTSIKVTNSTTALSSALGSLVTAYNGAMTELNKNHGTNGGALSGNSIVIELQQTLQNLVGYTSGDGTGISSLTDIGFTFDESGVLSFDPSVLASASTTQLQQISTFLGSATGGGFLTSATNYATSATDPTNGLLPDAIAVDTTQITRLNSTITDQQNSITNLQTSLTKQMNAADAAISSLEQQQNYLTSLFNQEQMDAQQIALA